MKYSMMFMSVVASVMLIGCGTAGAGQNEVVMAPSVSAKEESAGAGETEAAAEEAAAEETSNVWAVEPSIELTKVYKLENNPIVNFITLCIAKNGYPQNWKVADKYSYTPDSIAVKKDGKYGIMNYEGEILYDITIDLDPGRYERFIVGSDNPITSYGAGYLEIHNANSWKNPHPFAADFRSLDETVPAGGMGGEPEYLYTNNGRILSEFYGMITDHTGDFYPGESIFLPESNGINDPAIKASSLVDGNGTILYTVEGAAYNAVNEYFATSQSSDSFTVSLDLMKEGTVHRVRSLADGEPINDETYEEVKYFEEGFCPVKKNGKWGFIDAGGQAVTDYIWDDVSVVYDGKAYVGINGVYGIHNLSEAVLSGETVSMEMCYPGAQPEETDEVAEDTNSTDGPEPIGVIQVKSRQLNIHAGPGGQYGIVGECSKGEVYEFYETVTGSPTWYRIGENEYVPDGAGRISAEFYPA